MNKWKTGILFSVALLGALFATAAAVQQEQHALAEKLVRLHVVANSDSKEDQELKLQVRDAVLAVTSSAGASDGDPVEILEEMLPEIQKAAEECLKAHGSSEPVQVRLGMEPYPTRAYENFALPAGVYQSLRVIIGNGQGNNWWCVVFPSICFRATAAELEEAAQVAGMTEGEIRLITEASEGYILKFKTMEILEQIKEKFFR